MKKIFCLIMAAMLLLTGCKADNSPWVISIDNEKIYKNEFLVYLQEQKRSFEEQGGEDIWEIDFDGVSAWDVAKQNAANSVIMVKLAVSQAANLGVSIDAEQSVIDSDAQELYDSFTAEEIESMDITLDMIKDIIKEGYIQTQVYDVVTNSYQPNEQELEEYCQNYYNENIDMYKQVSLRSIYVAKNPTGEPMEEVIAIDEFNNRPKKEITVTGKDKIDEAYSLLQQGEDFNTVQYDYSEDPERLEFLLTSDMYNDEINDVLYNLKENEYSPVMEYEDGYYIFCAKEVSEISVDEIKDDLAESFEAEKKKEIYQEQNERWYSEVNVTRNNTVWDAIVRE